MSTTVNVTVHGPYEHRNRWRLHVKEGGRTIASPSYSTCAEANEAKAGYERITRADLLWEEAARAEEEAARTRALAEAATRPATTHGQLIDKYEMYLRETKQRKRSTVDTSVYQLRAILGPAEDRAATSLTKFQALGLYQRRAAEVAPATHHGDLRQVRSMWRWAAKQDLVRAGLWDEIEPIGTPAEGKDQLHPVAAELVYRHALAQAMEATAKGRRYRTRPLGAAAALCSLILGLRSGEIVRLTLDDLGGGILRVQRGKSRRARRMVRVPDPMWGVIAHHIALAQAAGRERLFPFKPAWVRPHVQRLCREVGVEEICAHALRGTHATLAVEAGATAELVARQLGHAGTAVTNKHYIDPTVAIEAAAGRVLAEFARVSTESPEIRSEVPAEIQAAGVPEADRSMGNWEGGQQLPTKKGLPSDEAPGSQIP